MKTADRLVREGVKGKITSVYTKPNTDWFGFILEEGKEIGDEIYFRVVSKDKKHFLILKALSMKSCHSFVLYKDIF